MGGVRKPLLELAGRPVLHWALQPFLNHPDVEVVVVALPAEAAGDPPSWLVQHPRVAVVAGGATRTDSVGAALAALPPVVTRVIVHDGARPIVRQAWIDGCLEVCGRGEGAVVGYPARDTLKEVGADARIESTPDRSRLWQVQTPQAFPRALLERAYAEAGPSDAPTDDAGLVERLGASVRVVQGDATNVKITRPEDLVLAEALLEQVKA